MGIDLDRPLKEVVDEHMAAAEAEWRSVRFRLWAGLALEAAAWFAGVLILHWFVEWLVGLTAK